MYIGFKIWYLLGVVGLVWLFLFARSFSIKLLLRHGNKYWFWYRNRQTFAEYLDMESANYQSLKERIYNLNVVPSSVYAFKNQELVSRWMTVQEKKITIKSQFEGLDPRKYNWTNISIINFSINNLLAEEKAILEENDKLFAETT